jgi:hypothetical protein
MTNAALTCDGTYVSWQALSCTPWYLDLNQVGIPIALYTSDSTGSYNVQGYLLSHRYHAVALAPGLHAPLRHLLTAQTNHHANN